MTSDEQLELWLAGESKCKNDRDECCPDFSCCMPDLKWPDEKRKKFVKAVSVGDDGTREKMLMGALSDAIGYAVANKKTATKVRVTRGVPEDDE